MIWYEFVISMFTGKAPYRKSSFEGAKPGAKRYYPRDANHKIYNRSEIQDIARKVDGEYRINGNSIELDCKGAIIDGKHQSGDGSQKEDQTKILDFRIPVIIRNAHFRNIKDGLTFRKKYSACIDCTFDLRNGGEDALSTTEDARDFELIGCRFIGKGDNDSDKAAQLNQASGAFISKCQFHGFTTAIRLHDLDQEKEPKNAKLRDLVFRSCGTSINASGIQFDERGTTNDGVRNPYHFGQGAGRA